MAGCQGSSADGPARRRRPEKRVRVGKVTVYLRGKTWWMYFRRETNETAGPGRYVRRRWIVSALDVAFETHDASFPLWQSYLEAAIIGGCDSATLKVACRGSVLPMREDGPLGAARAKPGAVRSLHLRTAGTNDPWHSRSVRP